MSDILRMYVRSLKLRLDAPFPHQELAAKIKIKLNWLKQRIKLVNEK